MDVYASKHGVHVQHKHYDTLTGRLCGDEHTIHGIGAKSRKTRVDGWIAETKTVLEFHGDYYHGNPHTHPPETWNDTTKCTFGALHDATMERMYMLMDSGFNVLYIWENDFRKWKKTSGMFVDLPVRSLKTRT